MKMIFEKIAIFFSYLVIILSPFLASLFGGISESDKFYPLWDYRLFASYPEIGQSYLIEVHELDSIAIPSNNNFLNPNNVIGMKPNNIILKRLVHAFEAKNWHDYEILKMMLDRIYFSNYKKISYSIIKETWNPRNKFLDNKNINRDKVLDIKYEK